MKYDVNYTKETKEGFGGRCEYPWFPLFGTCKITIKTKYRDDIGLLNHELKHAEQYSKDFLHSIKTKFSKKYRYKIELEAYTEQIKEYKYISIKQAEWIVQALLNKYDLGVSEDRIRNDVNNIIKVTNK